MRPVTADEKTLVHLFASKLGEQDMNRLLADLQCATAAWAIEDGSRTVFQIEGYERPPYEGQHPYGVEGKMLDEDGADLSVILYADENGHLLELELLRWDSENLKKPRWETLLVF